MLSLSLLAARARLLRGPAASRCVSAVARSVGHNAAVVSAPCARFETTKSRLFSTIDGPKDEDEDKEDKQDLDLGLTDEQEQPIDDGLSPLERLMQHSQQFRIDLDLEDDEDAANAGHEQDDSGDDKSQDEQDDEVFASTWQDETPSSKKKTSSNDTGSTRPSFKRNTFRRRGSSDRQSQLGKMAVNRLLQKDMDELNYDAELEGVWGEQELKQRKFHQHLRREQDRDHVCQNCGERGHRSRNCLVPRICSNCGNLGHSANQCRYRKSPDSIDEFLEAEEDFQKRQKKTRKFRKKAAIAAKNPQAPRPKGMPMSDYNRRNEVMREELESEIDAYADFLEEKDCQRKEQQRLKEAQDGKPNDAD